MENKHLIVTIIYSRNFFFFDGSTEHCLHSKHHRAYISSQVAKLISTVSHVSSEIHYRPSLLDLEVTLLDACTAFLAFHT